MAILTPDLCVRCGICVGSCKTGAIQWGILPHKTPEVARGEVTPASIYACECVVPSSVDTSTNLYTISCSGFLNMRSISHYLPNSSRIVIASCGWCSYREGHIFTLQRLTRKRRPVLPPSPLNSKIIYTHGFPSLVKKALTLPIKSGTSPVILIPRHWWGLPLLAVFSLFFALAIAFLSALKIRAYPYSSGKTWGVITINYATSPKYTRIPTSVHLEHMKKEIRLPEGRWPLHVVVLAGMDTLLQKKCMPGGIRSDLPVRAFEEIVLPAEESIRMVWWEENQPEKRDSLSFYTAENCQYHIILTRGYAEAKHVCSLAFPE